MRMRAVVGTPPGLGSVSGFKDRPKAIGVEQLVTNAGVERLDERVLRWLSRLDEEQFDGVFVRPDFKRTGDELGAVVYSEAFWVAMFAARFLELANHRNARI